MNAVKMKGGGFLILVAGILLGSWFLLQHLHPGNVEIAALRSQGWPLVLAYVAGMMLAGGFGIPPVLFILPAAAVWSLPLAMFVCLSGGLGAATLGFYLARYGFRQKVSPKIPPRLLKFERRLESHAFSTVLVMRLLFYLFPPINWMLGLSCIRPLTFVCATFIGMLPATFLYLRAGQGIWAFAKSFSPQQRLCLVLLAGLGIASWLRCVSRSK